MWGSLRWSILCSEKNLKICWGKNKSAVCPSSASKQFHIYFEGNIQMTIHVFKAASLHVLKTWYCKNHHANSSTITPILKKIRITGHNDYRPITFTSVVMTSFERLVLSHLKAIMGPLLVPHHHPDSDFLSDRKQQVRLGRHILWLPDHQLWFPTRLCSLRQWLR